MRQSATRLPMEEEGSETHDRPVSPSNRPSKRARIQDDASDASDKCKEPKSSTHRWVNPLNMTRVFRPPPHTIKGRPVVRSAPLALTRHKGTYYRTTKEPDGDGFKVRGWEVRTHHQVWRIQERIRFGRFVAPLLGQPKIDIDVIVTDHEDGDLELRGSIIQEWPGTHVPAVCSALRKQIWYMNRRKMGVLTLVQFMDTYEFKLPPGWTHPWVRIMAVRFLAGFRNGGSTRIVVLEHKLDSSNLNRPDGTLMLDEGWVVDMGVPMDMDPEGPPPGYAGDTLSSLLCPMYIDRFRTHTFLEDAEPYAQGAFKDTVRGWRATLEQEERHPDMVAVLLRRMDRLYHALGMDDELAPKPAPEPESVPAPESTHESVPAPASEAAPEHHAAVDAPPSPAQEQESAHASILQADSHPESKSKDPMDPPAYPGQVDTRTFHVTLSRHAQRPPLVRPGVPPPQRLPDTALETPPIPAHLLKPGTARMAAVRFWNMARTLCGAMWLFVDKPPCPPEHPLVFCSQAAMATVEATVKATLAMVQAAETEPLPWHPEHPSSDASQARLDD